MRYESPVTDGGRIALADLELPSGEHIAAGTKMGISWHAANLDPDVFDDPLRVDFLRACRIPTSASPVASTAASDRTWRGLEMRVALEVWHQRIPDYEIAPGSDLTYAGNPRAPHHLTLTW